MSMRLDYNRIAPAGSKALGGVYGYVLQSKLPSSLINLVYLRVSQINNCAYCLDMHTRELLKNGQKIEKLTLVQAWAEAGTLFDERELVDLTIAIGLMNAYNRMAISFRKTPQAVLQKAAA